MKKTYQWLLFPAILGLGMSMPSCPGQKEVQQSVEQLQQQNADLQKKITDLTNQCNALQGEMTQVKRILPQITGVLEAQKNAADNTEKRVATIEERINKRWGSPKRKK